MKFSKKWAHTRSPRFCGESIFVNRQNLSLKNIPDFRSKNWFFWVLLPKDSIVILPKPSGDSDDNLESAISDADEDGRDPGLRAALMSVVEQLHVLETTLGGKEDNEMIIDPIALYREL